MVLFLMIPLSLVAFAIAAGPILAAMLLRDAERVPEPARLPWGMGGTAAVPATPRLSGEDDRSHARAA
jgi:hypothetical protein